MKAWPVVEVRFKVPLTEADANRAHTLLREAFPDARIAVCSDGAEVCVHEEPESLRDRFAAHALSGLVSVWRHTTEYVDKRSEQDVADEAYVLADAMLKAREVDRA